MRISHVKVVAGALAATMFLGLAAWAQTAAPASTPTPSPSRCAAAPADPRIPDGATVSDRGIMSANEAILAWDRGLRATAECYRAEVDELDAQRRAKAQAHSALNAQLREVSARWAEQRNLYCARPRRECRTIGPDEVSLPAGEVVAGPCAETLSAPTPVIPDGASANQSQMDAADAAYLAWGREVLRNLDCRKNDFEQTSATLAAREADHARLAERLNSVIAQWEAAQQAYCARPRKQCAATPEQE